VHKLYHFIPLVACQWEELFRVGFIPRPVADTDMNKFRMKAVNDTDRCVYCAFFYFTSGAGCYATERHSISSNKVQSSITVTESMKEGEAA
jgi:hypothetical protein